MDDTSPKNRRRTHRRRDYDPEPFAQRMRELMQARNESMREASLRSGLDHQAVRRWVVAGKRPGVSACILLADHFGINPNELLELAGWPRLQMFDIKTESAEGLPPDVVTVALTLAKIPNPGTRREVSRAILTLLEKYFD